jgi:predicted sulfurtransferase
VRSRIVGRGVPEIFGTCLVPVNLDQKIRSNGPNYIDSRNKYNFTIGTASKR